MGFDKSSMAVPQTYTAEQVATILGVSIRKAYQLCESTTDFKVIRIGRCLRIHRESFDRWFNDFSGVDAIVEKE